MRVKCICNTGAVYEGYDIPIGYSRGTQFAVGIGEEYLVMGLVLTEGFLCCLIDDYGLPLLYPMILFEVVDAKVDTNWSFRLFRVGDDFYPYRQAIWGYPELCFDDAHFDGLMEQDPKEVEFYIRRKLKIMQEMSDEANGE